MATEMITLKLDSKFLKEVDNMVKKEAYQNRTEFIRESLRKNIDEKKLKQALREIAHLKGASKKKVTKEEYERAREEAFEKIAQKLR